MYCTLRYCLFQTYYTLHIYYQCVYIQTCKHFPVRGFLDLDLGVDREMSWDTRLDKWEMVILSSGMHFNGIQ